MQGPPSPSPVDHRSPSAAPPVALDRPWHGLSDDWRYNCTVCPAIGPHPIPVQYLLDQLIPELLCQGITDCVLQGQVMRQLLCSELREMLLRLIDPIPPLQAIVSTGRATL